MGAVQKRGISPLWEEWSSPTGFVSAKRQRRRWLRQVEWKERIACGKATQERVELPKGEWEMELFSGRDCLFGIFCVSLRLFP